jgi:transposase
VSLSQVSVCLSCQHEVSWERLLPHLSGTVVEAAELAGGRLCLWARARAGQGVCPRCGRVSGRVHSAYQRRLADAPAGGHRVVIRLRVRRFFCASQDCPAVTFAEQIGGLTTRRARRTPPLAHALTAVALALAGRAGARLAALLGLVASRSGLLRLVMALPDPDPGAVRVLGVDDFALRKGHNYGTVLVNVATGQPVDLLGDREAETFAGWLTGHPGAGVICRDRAGGYADGARTGAPAAVQVADRWHLWHNLAGRVAATVARHQDCLAGPEPEPEHQRPPGQHAAAVLAQPAEDGTLAAHVKDRYEQVMTLHAQGLSPAAIAARTGLARQTVRRYRQAQNAGELLAVITGGPPSALDEHKPYLSQRFSEGTTSARQLHAELRARGYHGSYPTVARYLQRFRPPRAAPPATPTPPTSRQLATWILTDPDNLADDGKTSLAQARQRCPHLDALAAHVTQFAKILTGLHGGRLDDWITAVEADDQPDLHSFARGIRRDYDAVVNGLTLPYSSGPVEGTVNKIKMIKRQMYGRASFPLLRKRVLLAT